MSVWERMVEAAKANRVTEGASLVALAAVAATALALRLQDPLSTRVIGAEDPFTHIVFAREYLADGYFGRSFHLATDMYPPGLHILAGAFWTVAGMDPYVFTRFFPPFLGAFAVVGVYALARRHVGAAGALAGALALALMPEHIFRTNLLFPTALDLALIPVLFFLILEAGEGRLTYLVPLGVMGLAMAIAHPWIIPLAGGPGLAYLVARGLTRKGPLVENLRRVAPAILTLGGLLGFAAVTRWDQSGSGFSDFLESAKDSGDAVLFVQWGTTAAAGALVLLYLIGRVLTRSPGRSVPALALRLALAGSVAALAAVALPHFGVEPQNYVDYVRMMGWPTIALGIAGLVIAAGTLTPLGVLAAALVLVTYPLTALNVFDSEYLPHRTVVYLAVGVTLLAALAVGRLSRTLSTAVTPRGNGPFKPAPGAVAGLLVLAGASAPVVAETPEPYEWYRYYGEEDFAAFEHVAGILRENPDAEVVSAQWQPNLMLKTLSPDMDRVHYSREFFRTSGERHAFLGEHPGSTFYVVVDEYTREASRSDGLDLAFLHNGDYTPISCECGKVSLFLRSGGTYQ